MTLSYQPSEDYRRPHETFQRFPKIPRTLLDISEDPPNTSEDFRRSPEQFQRFPKITRTLLKISKYHPNTSQDFQRSLDYFRRSPEHFRRFPKITRTLPRISEDLWQSPAISEDHRIFSKLSEVSEDQGPSLFFFRDSYCSFPCKALLPHELYNNK